MSQPPPLSRPTNPIQDIRIAPLAVWLLIQLLALMLSAARVPLWAKAHQPIEQYAIAQLIVVQIVASAMLFPWLMPNLATALAIIVSIAPMLMLGGMLAGSHRGGSLRAGIYVGVWLSALAVWSPVVRRRRQEMPAVAFASSLTIGPIIVRYVVEEFSTKSLADAPRVDPISAALSQLQSHTPDVFAWTLLGALMVIATLLRLKSVSTSYPQP